MTVQQRRLPLPATPLPNLNATADQTRSPSAIDSESEGSPLIDLIVPVLNEERVLGRSIRLAHDALATHFSVPFQISIVDNGSTDSTPLIGEALSREVAGVRFLRLNERGRGGALKAAWLTSTAKVLAYTDVDLSTDLGSLPSLIQPLLENRSDIAIGSRLASGAIVSRCRKRELLSRGYNRLLSVALQARFSDAQCGFKAIRREAAHALLPLVEDRGWFFDTELMVLAQRAGFRIVEVPVRWVEDRDSRVSLLSTVWRDLQGVWRLSRSPGFADARITAGRTGHTARAARPEPHHWPRWSRSDVARASLSAAASPRRTEDLISRFKGAH